MRIRAPCSALLLQSGTGLLHAVLINPLNPKIKIGILICCPYSFRTEVVGRS